MMTGKHVLFGLSDGGAHCGTICDAASPTFMLQHWVRDRAGKRIALEHAIKRQCRDTAILYGLEDRGVLAPGYLADLNVIDMEALKLGKPWLAFDLPAGGKRLVQDATGYRATLVAGEVIVRLAISYLTVPTVGAVDAASTVDQVVGPFLDSLARSAR